MKRCPACGHMEYEGALFCSECGAPLFVNHVSTYYVEPRKGFTAEIGRPASTSPHLDAQTQIVLLVTQDGRKIVLDPTKHREWTIGRFAPKQIVMPDVDLAPFDAYEHGVSRLHAIIRVEENGRVTISDLGSSNGTRLNGVKIPPNVPQPLHHGDEIVLGKLALKVLFQTSEIEGL